MTDAFLSEEQNIGLRNLQWSVKLEGWPYDVFTLHKGVIKHI